MSRELEFDGYWEGEAVYYCDCCHKREKFRFDSEDEARNYAAQKAVLRKKGWTATKVNGNFKDFCSEACRNKFIRNNTI